MTYGEVPEIPIVYMICNEADSCDQEYCYHSRIHDERTGCYCRCEALSTICRRATETEIVMARLVGDI